MKKLFFVVFLFLLALNSFTQEKYALVIGNGNYTSFGKLQNTINDANDIKAALEKLKFTVDIIIDGNRAGMIEGITRLKNRLSVSRNSYGFIFYAGHAMQFNGINYLIPANADIPSVNYLVEASVSVQAMLAELNDAGNELNVVVLDACRDFPASWTRSMNRGLSVVSSQPADSIIVFSTSAGSVASDGTGRNGLFTSHLLNHLNTPVTVRDLFDRTGEDVSMASGRMQIPAIYSQYFGTAYFGDPPAPVIFQTGAVSITVGFLQVSTKTAGVVEIRGTGVNRSESLPDWGNIPINLNPGSYRVTMRYMDGKTEEKTIQLDPDQLVKLDFAYQPPNITEPESKPRKTREPYSPVPNISYEIGYVYAPDLNLGFRVGLLGLYAAFGFDTSNPKATKEKPTSLMVYNDKATGYFSIIAGYQFNIIKNWLLVPIGMGIINENSYTQYKSTYDSGGKEIWNKTKTNTQFVFETGLVFTPGKWVSLLGTYRLIGFKESSFSIGIGLIIPRGSSIALSLFKSK